MCPKTGAHFNFYESTAGDVSDKMDDLMGTYAPDFDEYWLTETNLELWQGFPDYGATDSEILSFFEDLIDAAGDWDGTLIYCYHSDSIFEVRGHSTLEDGIYEYLNGME